MNTEKKTNMNTTGMESLPFDEVLDYYHRMDTKTRKQKLYKDLDSRATKELAIQEIDRRNNIYITEHVATRKKEIDELRIEIDRLLNMYNNEKDIEKRAQIGEIGVAKNRYLKKIEKELRIIWENSPEYLRYSSKYMVRGDCDDYIDVRKMPDSEDVRREKQSLYNKLFRELC